MRHQSPRGLRRSLLLLPLGLCLVLLVLTTASENKAFSDHLRIWLWMIPSVLLVCYGFAVVICLPVMLVLVRYNFLRLTWYLLGTTAMLVLPAAWFAVWPVFPPYENGLSRSLIAWISHPTWSLQSLDRVFGFIMFWTLSGLAFWWSAVSWQDKNASNENTPAKTFLINRREASCWIAIGLVVLLCANTLPTYFLTYWSASRDRSTRVPLMARYLSGNCQGSKPAITRNNANDKGSGTNCVLNIALYCGHHDVVLEVFEKGGDWQKCAKSGVELVNTWVIRCAHRENRTDEDNRIISLLVTKTGLTFSDLGESLLEAVQNCPESALFLLKNGTSANVSRNGITPLHVAVYRKRESLELVQALLEAGADVNARSKSGDTPLSYAQRFGQPEVVQLLLRHGAKDDSSRKYTTSLN